MHGNTQPVFIHYMEAKVISNQDTMIGGR
jgi:hypothetical protein